MERQSVTSTKSIVEIISDFFRGSSRPDFNGEWVCIATWGFLEDLGSSAIRSTCCCLVFYMNLAVITGIDRNEWCHAIIFRAILDVCSCVFWCGGHFLSFETVGLDEFLKLG